MIDSTINNSDKIFDILVEHAGAMEIHREGFANCVSHESYYPIEFRFQGDLGFGGKFRVGDDGRWYIDCYPEHENPERLTIIRKVNGLLNELQKRT